MTEGIRLIKNRFCPRPECMGDLAEKDAGTLECHRCGTLYAVPAGQVPVVRQVERSDSPLSGMERVRLVVKRFWRWVGPPPGPVRGRVDLIRAVEEGRFIPPQLDVRAVGRDVITVRARPKARMSLRVYRTDVGQWSDPVVVESIDVKAESGE